MGPLTVNDKIFATVSYAGRTLLNTSFTGVTSIAEIFSLIRTALSGFIGYVNLRLRNSSQGWSQQRGLRIGPTERNHAAPFLPEATQLSLF